MGQTLGFAALQDPPNNISVEYVSVAALRITATW